MFWRFIYRETSLQLLNIAHLFEGGVVVSLTVHVAPSVALIGLPVGRFLGEKFKKCGLFFCHSLGPVEPLGLD